MLAPYTFVFVSHVSEDRSAATALVAELEGRGIPCWVAPRDVNPGRPFDVEIAEAIETCRSMLLVFSERCNESDYIRREVTVAGDVGKVIIPYRIEDARPKGGLRVRLSDLHWIDAFDHPERALEALVGTLLPAGELFLPPDSKETASYSPLIAVEGTNTTAADSASGQDAVERPSPTSLMASENSTKTATRAADSTSAQDAIAQPSPSIASKVLQLLIERAGYAAGVGIVVIAVGAFAIARFYSLAPVGAPPASVSADQFEANLLAQLKIRPDPAVVAATPPPPAPPPSRESNFAERVKAVTRALAAPPPVGPPVATEGAAPNEVPNDIPRWSPPIRASKTKSGNWMIQIGAYKNEAEAKQRLADLQSKAMQVLADADPYTVAVDKDGTTYYHAGFRNLAKSQAESACKTLKDATAECVVIENVVKLGP